MSPLQAIIFFACLAGLFVLIWLFSLISTAINDDESDQTTEPTEKQYSAANFERETVNKQLVAIQNIINIYREQRHSDERKRGKREKITVVIIGLTAIFAAGATVAAGISAWIFDGQLAEMHTASALTRAQLRANVELLSFTSTLLPNGDWQIQPIWHNQGSTNANEFEQWVSYGIYTPDVEADFDFSKPEKPVEQRHAMTLAGNAQIKAAPVMIIAANIQVVSSGTAKLYIWGDASYKDIFFPTTEIHHTHYCSDIIVPDAKNPGLAVFDAYRPECNYAN